MPVMNIWGLRLKAGLSQPQLAQAMGVHLMDVIAWEHETYLPKTRQLPLLARILGCTVDELFIGED